MKKFLIFLLLLTCGVALAQVSARKQDAAAGKAREGRHDTELPVLSTLSRGLVDLTDTLVVWASGGSLVFEGATDNAYETTLAAADATADRTLTLPNATGSVEALNVYAHASTATLSSNELYGGTLTNTGASGAVVLTLPAPVVGMHFRVWLTVAQDVDINPADGTQILVLTNATGDAISSAATIGNSIELVALSSTAWAAFATSGTWSDAN